MFVMAELPKRPKKILSGGERRHLGVLVRCCVKCCHKVKRVLAGGCRRARNLSYIVLHYALKHYSYYCKDKINWCSSNSGHLSDLTIPALSRSGHSSLLKFGYLL